jgi:hypothetical protein
VPGNLLPTAPDDPSLTKPGGPGMTTGATPVG